MTNSHFILDFETLSTNTQKCPVLDCAYFVFDWDRFLSDKPYTFEELVSSIKYDKLNIREQIKAGAETEASTIEFWKSVSSEAKDRIMPSIEDILVEDFLNNLETYLKANSVTYWWSRSNTFDPIILTRLAGKRFDNLLKFWYVRDTRTFIDAKLNFPKINGFCPYDDEVAWNKIFHQHNCVHDVAADILRLQKLTRLENGLSSL